MVYESVGEPEHHDWLEHSYQQEEVVPQFTRPLCHMRLDRKTQRSNLWGDKCQQLHVLWNLRIMDALGISLLSFVEVVLFWRLYRVCIYKGTFRLSFVKKFVLFWSSFKILCIKWNVGAFSPQDIFRKWSGLE